MGFINFNKSFVPVALTSDNQNGCNIASTHVTRGSSSIDQTNMNSHKTQDNCRSPKATSANSDSDAGTDIININTPQGTKDIQATTYLWSKRDLIVAYILIWLMEFMLSFISGSTGVLTPYVTSSFQLHSLTALTSVIASIIAGIWKLPYAKIMNIWGRPQALIIGVGLATIGLVSMAACHNVQTYCAAMTFYYTGYNSIDFSVTVFVADTSKLKNRALYIAYVASPWMITTWIYGYAITDVMGYGGIGWRWAFGIYSIVLPCVSTPLAAMMLVKQARARKEGLVEPRRNHGTFAQTLKYYGMEFDVIGLLILATGLALFLLAFNLYSYQAEQWKSPMIISFLIFGGLLIVAFGVWEKYFAPMTFVPWHLLTNRTVIFTYTMAAALYISWYTWDTYFYSLLIVVFRQTIVHATYISQIWTVGSCFISIVFGFALRYYGRLKWWALLWGIPLTVLGCALMIRFRQPGENIGFIVTCQIFIAFGGGVLVISEQVTLMAVSKQEDFPALLACESMVIAIASAVGSTVAGAMWTGIFPTRLRANLPASALDNFDMIYGDLETQSSYAWGSATRDAIDLSYGQTQRYMLIAATCIYATMFVSVALWQDVDVRRMKQRVLPGARML